MKKTIQTLMTAAVFAAALGTGVGDTISAQYSSGADDVTTVPQTTYGPPVWMQTTDETEEETTDLRDEGEATVYTDDDSTTPLETNLQLSGQVTIPMMTTTLATTLSFMGTTAIPQQSETTTCTTVAFEGTAPIPTTTEPEELVTPGEAPLYHEPGDPDYNGSIDARDLTLLKQYLLSNKAYGIDAETYDVNMDGDINREDVKALLRLLTGKPEDEGETTSTDTSDQMTTTTTLGTSTCPLYGPPPAY